MVRGNSLPKIAKSQSGIVRLLFLSVLAEMFLHSCWAQDLAPRAYLITSLHSNAINLTCSFYTGGLDFNGLPITGATGTYSVPSLSFYHSSSFFGRSANVTVWLPYGVGTFQGPVLGTNKQIYRSGLYRFRISLFRESEGWPRDAHLAVREVEANGGVGRQPESNRPDWPV
jgi:hypothetical protein